MTKRFGLLALISKHSAFGLRAAKMLLPCLLGTLLLSCTQVNIQALAADDTFLVKPYLQLGYEHGFSSEDLVWFSNQSAKWEVQYKPGQSETFQTAAKITDSLITLPGQSQPPFHKYAAKLSNLTAGVDFEYKVKADGKEVFAATGKAIKKPEQPYKVAVFGDCGAGTDGQKRLADRIMEANPDIAVITGDIVYQHGLFSQYLTNYFPIYNKDVDKNNKASGIPLLRSIPTVGILGNHDIALGGLGTNLDKYPDGLAYYLFWNQPLNGYARSDGEKNTTILAGSEANQKAFKTSAGKAFPRMANFSFDYGNSHWTVLDGNYYMDWSDPTARQWLENDLKASKATWKFVTFHQPAFSIDLPHAKEQRMRLITDILQKNKVDIVFCGHAHCYERSYPLEFGPKAGAKLAMNGDGTVDGAFTLDKDYDGVKVTKPKGIIHIVTGAGGARLYPQGQPSEEILKFDSDTYSFTDVQVNDKTAQIKQIDDSGKVLDQFTVTK